MMLLGQRGLQSWANEGKLGHVKRGGPLLLPGSLVVRHIRQRSGGWVLVLDLLLICCVA